MIAILGTILPACKIFGSAVFVNFFNVSMLPSQRTRFVSFPSISAPWMTRIKKYQSDKIRKMCTRDWVVVRLDCNELDGRVCAQEDERDIGGAMMHGEAGAWVGGTK